MSAGGAGLVFDSLNVKGEDPLRKRLALFGLLLVGSVALILRLHNLTARGIWFDEGFSAMIARLRWSQFALVLWNREGNMAFYYLILHFWEKFGGNPAFLRILSVIFSVSALPLTYLLGARLFDRKIGLIAAWLLAINAYDVRYAQEVRSYALVLLLSLLSTWLLVANLLQPSPAWGRWTITNLVLVYSHFVGGLVVIAQLFSLLFLPRTLVPWRAIGRSLLWFCVFLIPIPFFITRAGTGTINWIPRPDGRQILEFFTVMAGNGGKVLLAFSTIGLVIAGLRGWQIWQFKHNSLEAWPYVLTFAWLIVPIALTLFISFARPLFVTRYLLFCLPPLLLGVAVGIARLRPRLLAIALFLTISIFTLWGTVASYRKVLDDPDQEGDWRAASSYIFERAQPGDGVFFFFTFGRVPFEYYRLLRGPAAVWPKALYAPGGSELQWKDFMFFPLANVLAETQPASKRVWVVFNHDGTAEGWTNRASLMTRAMFAKDRQEVAEKRFPGIVVMLFSRDVDERSALLFVVP